MKLTNNKIDQYLQNIANEKIAGCLLYGAEATISRYRFELIAKKIVGDLSDPFLVTEITGDKLKENSGIIADEFYSIPMFGGRKLIMIRDGDRSTISGVVEGLKILFSDPKYGRKSDNFILILAGDLEKTSSLRKLVEDAQFMMAIASYEENQITIKNFISDIFNEKKIQADKKIIDELYKNFGKDRQYIVNEINRIECFLGEEKNLTLEIYHKLSSTSNEDDLQNFAIEFANKNYELCYELASKAFEHKDESVMLVRYLIIYFQKLYNAKIALEHNKSTIEDLIKAGQIFFKVENDFRRHLQNLSTKFICKILQSFENLEINLKKGDMPSRLVFLAYIRGFIVKKRGV